MRNCCLLLALAGAVALAFSSCVKAPELTVTSPSSIDVSVDGSSSKITFTANRDWTVRSSESWVIISPSSGTATDGPVTVNVSCSANTTYEDRIVTITISMEELSQTVTVKQPANLGIIVPTKSYDLASNARSIDVEVQANVQYSVSISDKWIKQTGTKGLTTNKVTFSIEENDTYDARSATITIKPQNATVAEQVITVRQNQKDALIVKDKSYDMPYGGGEIEVNVEANVGFNVVPSVDWIHHVETKGLSASTIRLTIDANRTTTAREGVIEISQKNGSLSHTITVRQDCFIAVSSLTLDKTSLAMALGDEVTLSATVLPSNATNKTILWNSSNPSIATVDANGTVKAVGKGSAIITANAGNYVADCKVSVRAALYPTPAGAVDLGLSVVWAEKNLGASSGNSSGNYYLWGDSAGTGTIMSFNTPNTNTISDTQYDIAKATLGEGWRLPTREEIKELLSSCIWEKVSNGVKLTGPNGNSLILPLTGMAFPADGSMGSYSLTSKDQGYLMTGESYADGYGRFAYVYHYDQNFKYNWSSYNAPMAKFPVRPVFESLDGSIHVSSIALNKTALFLKVGENETLVATILPNDATDKTIAWSSSDESIAAVDEGGKVTAIKTGSATIMAKAGEKSAECNVSVKSGNTVVPSGAVDLGLSVLWAKSDYNMPYLWDLSGYFLWGDPTGNGVVMDYVAPELNNIADTQYDIARVKLGKGWRLPTIKEVEELFSACTWHESTTGARLYGPNGETILFRHTGLAMPSDGPIGSVSVTSKDKGYVMTGESTGGGESRMVFVYQFDKNFSYNLVSYNAMMAKFPVRPVYESLDGSIPVSSISLNKTELAMNVGDSETLTATVKPDDATDKTVTWKSSNASVATVDENGKVTAIKGGSATITATAGEKSASCSVSIQAATIKVTSVTLNKTSLTLAIGSSETLIATLNPSNANEAVHWGTTKPAIATVDSNGQVTGVKAGSATITVIAGEKTASCEVTVVPNVQEGNIPFADATLKKKLVELYDSDGDGEISFKEAAAVTTLEKISYVFRITSFNEFRYFIGVKAIPDYAFYKWKELKSIILPEGLTKIGIDAFSECEALSYISIPESLTTIDASAFSNCSSLTTISLSDNVTSIGGNAFAYTSLSSFTFPSKITSISATMFYGCKKLTTLTIPNSITSIGRAAFGGSGLELIDIPSSVKQIGMQAFLGTPLT